MTSTKTQTNWDLTPVFDLVQSLRSEYTTNDDTNAQPLWSASYPAVANADGLKAAPSSKFSLGNFDRLWDHLGVSRDVPIPTVPHFAVSTLRDEGHVDKDAYASDGALYYPPSSKSVTWKDDDGQNLTDIAPPSPTSPSEAQLNKNQRKKRNRKLKKSAERDAQLRKARRDAANIGSSASADETEDSPPLRALDSPLQAKSKKKTTTPYNDGSVSDHVPRSSRIRQDSYIDFLEKAAQVEARSAKTKAVPAELSTGIKPAANSGEDKVSTAYKSTIAIGTAKGPASVPTATADAVKLARERVHAALNSTPKKPVQPTDSVTAPAKNAVATPATKSSTVKQSHDKVQSKDFANQATKPVTGKVNDENTGQPSSTPVADVPKSSSVSTATPEAIRLARERVNAAMKSTPPKTPDTKKSSDTANTIHASLQKQWPVANPYAALSSLKQEPSTPTRSSRLAQPLTPQSEKPKSSAQAAQIIHTPSSTGPKRHEILPLHNIDSIERNWSLFMKVMTNFPQDRKHLVSPLQLSINKPVPNGIHVFVDVSNIAIGFTEHLKRVRGIHRFARVPHVDLNFHALALLLERRRPITKRVLAGSLPEVRAFQEARDVGYETCILDKVFKARELTERQKFFEGYTTGDGSDGNSNVPPQQPKWVEQAVDEILHLKICESVIDTPAPSADAGDTVSDEERPTMVVATGDAAQAEYSPGFLKMVERALIKGWNVEVMAFAKSVSMGYRRMAQLPMGKGGWGERFKIIELDEYSEELFGQAM